MKKKKPTQTVSEASIPAGVYPELDRDLGRDKRSDGVPVGIPVGGLSGIWPGTIGNPFPMGIYPALDDFPTNRPEDWPKPEDAWTDPRLR